MGPETTVQPSTYTTEKDHHKLLPLHHVHTSSLLSSVHRHLTSIYLPTYRHTHPSAKAASAEALSLPGLAAAAFSLAPMTSILGTTEAMINAMRTTEAVRDEKNDDDVALLEDEEEDDDDDDEPFARLVLASAS